MKKLVPLGTLALGAAAIALTGCAQSARGEEEMPAQPVSQSVAKPAGALKVGDPAPNFSLPDQNNKTHSLADYKGKTVVLAFYPADMTGGCTLEAKQLTAALPDFEKRGVQVFGVSVQGVESKKEFCDKEGITYPLLADTEKSMSRDYGVLGESGMANRVTFVVAPNGNIAAVNPQVKPASAAVDTLAMVDEAAKSAATTGAATADTNAKVKLGEAVAPFTLTNFDGKEVTVGNWDAHKATVVMFVSTQCPVSNAYNERMIALYREYAPKGVNFIGINSNRAETPEAIAAHAEEAHIPFPVLKDTGNAIADRFEAEVTPHVYGLDSKGALRYVGRIDDSQNPNGVTKQDLKAAIDAVLAGQAVPAAQTKAFGCGIKRAQ